MEAAAGWEAGGIGGGVGFRRRLEGKGRGWRPEEGTRDKRARDVGDSLGTAQSKKRGWKRQRERIKGCRREEIVF